MNTTNTTTMTTTPVTTPPAPRAPAPTTLPTDEQVERLLALLDEVRTALGSWATPLTALQRRRGLRFRKGGQPTADLVASLGLQYAVQIPGIDPQRIKDQALLVQRIQPLETKLRVVAGLVTDTVASAKTEAWQGTTALYTALNRGSKRNAALQRELAPAVAFFKRAKATKAGATPPPDAKSTPTSVP